MWGLGQGLGSGSWGWWVGSGEIGGVEVGEIGIREVGIRRVGVGGDLRSKESGSGGLMTFPTFWTQLLRFQLP